MMNVWEVKRVICNYKEDDEITLYSNGIRIKGILIDYDDDVVKIKPFDDEEMIVLLYEEIEDI